MAWYIFRLDGNEWTRIKKTFESEKEAKDYLYKHNYQPAMISNNPEIYRRKEK